VNAQVFDRTINHRVIEVSYLESEGHIIIKSWVQITNTSLSEPAELGTIYVLHGAGIGGEIYDWHELESSTLSPLGSLSFSIEETGAPPLNTTGPRGGMVAIVTWTGPANAVKLSGHAAHYDYAGNPLGSRSLQPF